MLPPDPILRAACHWLDLLQRSPMPTAQALIRAESGQRELTLTQYSTALDWLISNGLLIRWDGQLAVAPRSARPDAQSDQQTGLPPRYRARRCRMATRCRPIDQGPTEVPQDTARVAAALGLGDGEAFAAIRQVHGRVDLELRSRIGAAGERALVKLLEAEWPGAVVHVALANDGFGYDVLLYAAERAWHLEVKTSTRQGRSVIYLSRHEFEVARFDDNWRLILIILGESGQVASISTIDHKILFSQAPHDVANFSRWESARFEVTRDQQMYGLAFLRQELIPTIKNGLLRPPPLTQATDHPLSHRMTYESNQEFTRTQPATLCHTSTIQ